jgi:aminoglycoside 2''-phosphotransferase
VVPDLPERAELIRAASALWPEVGLSGFRINPEGWANLVLETKQRIVFRFPRTADAARGLGFEVRLLEYLVDRLSVPIPEPARLGTLARPRGWPFLSYRRLPGVSLSSIPVLRRSERVRLRDFLRTLLAELAGLPAAPLRRLGCEPGHPAAWKDRYLRLRAAYEELGSARVPPELDRRVRGGFDSFLRTLRESRYRPVLSHLDLGPYNILWDRRAGRPTGVVDWEDSRFADPAFDLTGLGLLGPLADELLRDRRASGDVRFRERLDFYRRVTAVHELVHAVRRGKPGLRRRSVQQLAASFAESTGAERARSRRR